MQYGQIVFLLFVAMVFYYAAMIFMDFQRAKAAQNAEQDSHNAVSYTHLTLPTSDLV